MSQVSTKQELSNYLKSISNKINFDNLDPFTTSSISMTLNISRSVTSQYLNELVKENKVIKISSRPVYYIEKDSLEKIYCLELNESEYLSVNELMKEIHSKNPDLKDFSKVIGNEGSLNYVISQIKSALEYPQGGLPIILSGQSGCGKAFLIQCMQEYCMNKNITKDRIPLIHKKIYEGESSTQQIEEIFGKLDGEEETKGLLEKASGGILAIYNANNLSETCQEKLAEYINTGKYSKLGEDVSVHKEKVRIVLTTHEDPNKVLNSHLLLNIPVICQIPSLMERSEDERIQFIIKFFQEEQGRLSRKIFISERLKDFLTEYRFVKNIDEMKKCIQATCATALRDCKEDGQMNVYIYHLPPRTLQQIEVKSYKKQENNLIRIDSIVRNKVANQIIQMWSQLIECFQHSKHDSKGFLKFIEDAQRLVRRYYDVLVFQETYQDVRLSSMQKVVMHVLEKVQESKNIKLPVNCAYVITRMMISSNKNSALMHQWEMDHQEDIQACIKSASNWMKDEWIIADMILNYLHVETNTYLSDVNKIFLMINIRMYNKNIQAQDTMGIILSHGYSTASSIADAANSLLNTFLFEAFDMPLDTSIETIHKKLIEYIEENYFLKNIILLVDMGSLEGLGEALAHDVNVGVINNISTSLALNVGMKMIQGKDLEDILKEACEENQCNYKVISVANKEKTIVFTNDAGITVSERLCSLFRDSLPKEIDLNMIEYDYDSLVKNGMNDPLFEKYEVVLIVKPLALNLRNVRGVSLEEIMSFGEIEKVNDVLSPYLTEEEIESFDNRLLKNFSLQSIMENLTILNPKKLLDYVSDAVTTLQIRMHQKFHSRTIVGIYMHVCFLVERLVTKTSFDSYSDITGFIENHQDFIDCVNSSFSHMLDSYHVEMPIYEIAYLYEYIQNDCREVGGEDEF